VSTVLRRSPVAALTAAAGAVSVEEGGWEIPASFGDDAAEREAIGSAVSLSDVTARAKVDVRGEVAGVLPAAAGALTARVAADWALVLGAPGEETRLLPALEAAAGSTAMVTDATHLHAGFALAGPKVLDLLERVTSWDPSALRPGDAAGAPIVEIPSVILRRDLPLPLFEVYVPSEFGRYAWEALASVVADLGGGPAGWQVLRSEGWR
jgi:glycine cleavage system aminomethyltransferase T